MKQQEIFGVGSLNKIGRLASRLKAKKIFLVTGGNSYQTSGAKKALGDQLAKAQIITFSDFEINPKLKDIKRGIGLFKKTRPDLVIAIGGGSVIDVAKAVNSLAANPGDSADYIKGKRIISQPGKPLIAVPTTSGSGSEATHFAVVYIGKTKHSLAHTSILPTIALVDPRLTFNLPSKQTVASGLDALSQAIEAYWSVNSTPLSKRYSARAIKLAMKNLKTATTRSTKTPRVAMSQAAHLAGKAINIAKTTACHAISYPLTSFFGIPHGHAVALTLSSLLRFNASIAAADSLEKRGVVYVKKMLKKLSTLIAGTPSIEVAANKLDQLLTEVGVETELSKLNINRNDIEQIIKNGFNPDRVKNNPRQLTRDALRQILVKLL